MRPQSNCNVCVFVCVSFFCSGIFFSSYSHTDLSHPNQNYHSCFLVAVPLQKVNKCFVFTLDFFVVFSSFKPFSSFINAAARSRDEIACFARPKELKQVCVKSERDILNLSQHFTGVLQVLDRVFRR